VNGGVLLAASGDSFSETVTDGSLLLAIPVAGLAGLVAFASPCVLPLVPGYLAYVTGLTGTDLAEAKRGRVLLGTSLFVLGFTAVFVSYGALFNNLGSHLTEHEEALNRVLGVVTILFGLGFIGATRFLPWLQREYRFLRHAPSPGLLAAPVLGVLFGIGWSPCIGPTLGAVLSLSYTESSAGRGALLTFVYCLGLGLPFIGVALGLRRVLGAMEWVRGHYQVVTYAGGAMLCILGVLLVTGAWTELSIELRVWTSKFEPSI
jgi:cytochrome c-type biogenesis protein